MPSRRRVIMFFCWTVVALLIVNWATSLHPSTGMVDGHSTSSTSDGPPSSTQVEHTVMPTTSTKSEERAQCRKPQSLSSVSSILDSTNGNTQLTDGQKWLTLLLTKAAQFLHETGDKTENGQEDKTQHDAFCDHVRESVWTNLSSIVSPTLFNALTEMRKRHEAVWRGRPYPRQKYLIWSLSGGLGNRFLSIVSTFTLAMLSERVFLMKDWFTKLPPQEAKQVPIIHPSNHTTDYFLEDLQSLFDPATMPQRSNTSHLLCTLFPMMSLSQFFTLYKSEFAVGGSAQPQKVTKYKPLEDHVKIDISARHDKTLARWNRILCQNYTSGTAMQPKDAKVKNARSAASFFQEKFVYIWTNQYYLPALYANPFHGKQMRSMFVPSADGKPSRPYNTMLRLLIIPALPVLRNVLDFFAREIGENTSSCDSAATEKGNTIGLIPGQYVGLQIRAFHKHVMRDMASGFDRCLKAGKSNAKEGERKSESTAPFFLASMHPPVRDYFKRMYGLTARTLSNPRHNQGTGQLRLDQEALTDMLLLSLSRRLLISPGSTFGVFAGAYGEMPLVRVNYAETGKGKICQSLPSHQQPCFGSWFRYDHLSRKSQGGPNAHVSCALEPIPAEAMNCD